jgi:hypothetical protein
LLRYWGCCGPDWLSLRSSRARWVTTKSRPNFSWNCLWFIFGESLRLASANASQDERLFNNSGLASGGQKATATEWKDGCRPISQSARFEKWMAPAGRRSSSSFLGLIASPIRARARPRPRFSWVRRTWPPKSLHSSVLPSQPSIHQRPSKTEGEDDNENGRGILALKPGFHCVPEGLAIVARRFIAGLAVDRDLRPGGTLEVGSGCYESAVPDRFKVEIATRRATSPAQEEPSQRNNDVPKNRPQLPFVIFASSSANLLGLLLSPSVQIQASLRDAGSRGPGTRR